MDFENMDPLTECGARWEALLLACQKHSQALAASQKEIYSMRQVELARHQLEMDRITQERENRSAQCERTLQHSHDQAVEGAALELKNITDALRVNSEQIRNKLNTDIRVNQSNLEESIWLAESILETGLTAPRIEFEATCVRIHQLQITLQQSSDDALRQLKRYRQSLPPSQPIDSHPEPNACEKILSLQTAIAMDSVERFRKLKLAGLFRGPILLVPTLMIMGLLTGVCAIVGIRGTALAGSVVIGFVLSVGGILALWFVARKQVRKSWLPISNAYQMGLLAAKIALHAADEQRKVLTASAIATRDREVQLANEKWTPLRDIWQNKAQLLLQEITQVSRKKSAAVEEKKIKLLQSSLDIAIKTRAELFAQATADGLAEKQRNQTNRSKCDAIEGDQLNERRTHWLQQRYAFDQWSQAMTEKGNLLLEPWDKVAMKDNLIDHISDGMAFGWLKMDLSCVASAVPKESGCAWPNSDETLPVWNFPAYRRVPNDTSLFVEAPSQSRVQGLEMLQSAALRLLTQSPAGKVRFYFFDPVGLGQSFAGFMHLADVMESLVNERIWSEPRHIEQKLIDLTEYVETVIQKYLRNEFATIADYNKQAGELAEPLRVVVFADFPEGLTDAACKRFVSLLQSGARCGVHFLLLRDPAKPLPELINENELLQKCARVRWKQDRFVVDAVGLESVPFTPGTMPSAAILQSILQKIGLAAKSGSKVEVPFQAIEPKMDQRWTSSSAKILRVPVGRSGANKLQAIEIGEGTRQHVLLAGKTGSGKSTLLHALITNVALWYSPDEVELWLIDFKKGVEFKAYATHALPHARAVAVESDREFGLSVLQGLDAELKRRGDLFRDAGVQDLAAWRSLGKQDPMPRTLLIVDEFQELFVEEDKVAQDSSLLLDRLVRQGRAFGMHVILGSQTLGGTYALPRTTMGQMGIRIALQCNEADSAMILSDDNTAARLLSRPGEAIYNDAGGLIEGNSPFQVVWLTDAQRDERVRELAATARARGVSDRKMIVFDGTAAARIEQCQPLLDVLKQPASRGVPALNIFLGNPVAIRNASVITLRRQSGANIVVVGQREDVAAGLSVAVLASFAAATRHTSGRVILLDGTTPDSPTVGALQSTLQTLKLNAEVSNYRDCDGAILQLGQEVAQRIADGRQDQPPILLMIHGLQRYRTLRKDEDDFSMSSDGPPKPDKVLGAILRDGPSVGVHVFAWADTAPSLQRCIDRNALREFDFRVLMQMSANDSSYLMDTPTATRLGADRALIFSEEKGSTERFRPFELASEQVLAKLFTSHS